MWLNNRLSSLSVVALMSMMLVGASCKDSLKEDASAYALTAGQATMILGGCQRPMTMGYDNCQVRRGGKIPLLTLAFLNAAEYAVSDCELNIYKTGKVDGPSIIDLDMSGLDAQAQRLGFCFVRIEAKELYPDPRDEDQNREIPFAGGFFVEVLDDNYIPNPPASAISWCYKIQATNKGRRTIESCN